MAGGGAAMKKSKMMNTGGAAKKKSKMMNTGGAAKKSKNAANGGKKKMMFGGAAGMAGPKRLKQSPAQKRKAATPKKVTPPKNIGGNNQLAGKPRTLGRGTGPKGKVMTPPVKRKKAPRSGDLKKMITRKKASKSARGRGSARRGRGGI